MSNLSHSLALDPPTTTYRRRVRQLSERSVTKHFQAFVDVDWEAHSISADDPRFELGPDHPLGSTEWYRGLPAAQRSRLGLDLVTTSMKTGVVFENVLQRGLLELALQLPDGDPTFRYAYHEVIEEAQHSLMFQEFINRSGRPGGDMDYFDRTLTRFVASLGRRFPELFMLFVLGGEEPIDHEQREALERRDDLHPLLARIMQIHITEEARHLCFARSWLHVQVPKLSRARRALLSVTAPLLLGFMARTMLEPPRSVIERHGVPAEVVRQAYHENETHRQRVRDSLSGVSELCHELGLVGRWTRPLWRWAL